MVLFITRFHSIARTIFLAAILAGAAVRSDPVISEFMAANSATLADEDGTFADWIELHNPDKTTVDLNGWYLTDSATNKTKWQFPAVTIPAGGYLVVFASDKNRRDPTARLHTNFALAADGEYLALIKPDGTTAASEFAPKYPPQQGNVSYGFPSGASSGNRVFLLSPTPGAANSGASPIGLVDTVVFSRAAGPFSSPFSLTLSGAGTGLQIRYTVTPAANGARTAVPTATSTLYSGPISITGASVVCAAIFSADGSTRGPVRSVYYSQVGPAVASFTTPLPVLVIDTLGSGALVKDGVERVGWLHTYAPRANNAAVFSGNPDLASPITITVRGATSAEFPKKSYNFKFVDEFGYQAVPALLDLPNQEKWALVGPWLYDPAFIKNSFVYELSNRLGRWAPRTRLVEVYFNANGNDLESADYAGIYVLTDRIEVGKKRVDVANLTPDEVTGTDLTGGYILKIDVPDPDEIGWVTNRWIPNEWQTTLVLVAPSAANIVPAQLSYIKDYVQRMEDALLASRDSGWARRTYLDYLDRASCVDHHLLNTFVANPDAFQRSAYFTKDKNGRIAAGPVWDFDRALGCDADFGVRSDFRSYRFDVWSGLGAVDVWQSGWWGILARDPEFMQDWIDRWQTLRRGDFADDKLVALLDALSANLGAAAARDAARWPQNVSPRGSYAAQMNFQKTWATQRAGWIDSQFLAAPSLVTAGNSHTFTAPAGAQLAYTLDGSDPRSVGGGVAANARVTSDPLVLSTSNAVSVRSYKASLRGVFPGSPWSSALRIAPSSRLSNLSVRTAMASGQTLIVGVVVNGGARTILVRAVGPALAGFGLTNAMADPQLELYNGSTRVLTNDNWGASLAETFTSVGAFGLPAGSRDAAFVQSIDGARSIWALGTGPGVVLVEAYDTGTGNSPRLINVSARNQVGVGDDILIAGFNITGSGQKQLLIRAVGPKLGGFSVSGFLADPKLEVYGGATKLIENDNWDSALAPTFAAVGAFALDPGSRDAALLTSLAPGSYTVQVRGADGGTGEALVELYEVP